MYQYHWPERPSSNKGRFERITSVIACLLSMIALLKKYERAQQGSQANKSKMKSFNSLAFENILRTIFSMDQFKRKSSFKNTPFQTTLNGAALFFCYLFPTDLGYFSRESSEIFPVKDIHLDQLKQVLGAAPRHFLRPCSQSLRQRRRFSSRGSYPPPAHRVMTHSKALILSKLFHTAQTGIQHKV